MEYSSGFKKKKVYNFNNENLLLILQSEYFKNVKMLYLPEERKYVFQEYFYYLSMSKRTASNVSFTHII